MRDPLPLPLFVDQNAVKEFDYRRVYATGRLRHDEEMLVGPRIREGEDGYLVVTPLEREEIDDRGKKYSSKVLVCRGWISKKLKEHKERLKMDGKRALPTEEVMVQGLLREPFRKNYFTPNNDPKNNAWYFLDIAEMADHTHSQPVWIEETMRKCRRNVTYAWINVL